jgi:hypothetical protein
MIYTSNSVPEEYSYEAGEGTIIRENLVRDPIKVRREQKGPEGDLGSLSRINYSKIYTVDNYVRVLTIGMVTKDSLPNLIYSSYINPTLKPPEPPSNLSPKSTRVTADKRNKISKPSVNRAKVSGSAAQMETSAEEGQSMNPNEQSSDHDRQVSTTIAQPENLKKLDNRKR